MAADAVFDVVIVGAGPAGCVLASRLSEDASRSVALIEAGPDYGTDRAAWPSDLRDPWQIWRDSHTWGFTHANRPTDRPSPLARAKVVGGSSTVNGCVWLRGSAADYDQWAELGNRGWAWADMLRYFRKIESDPLGGDLHGIDGLVPVYRVDTTNLNPVDQAFVATAYELGFDYVADANGAPGQRPGVGPLPKNIADGERINAAFTYLAQARGRDNLTIIPDTHVDKVAFGYTGVYGLLSPDGRVITRDDEGVAVGDKLLYTGRNAVGVYPAGKNWAIMGREVIIATGAYCSPAILMRSGIGPAARLQELGIPVIADRPGVGEHLLDHPNINEAFVRDFEIKPEFAPAVKSYMPLVVKGRANASDSEIDYHLYLGQVFDEERDAWVFWMSVPLQWATSRGRVRIISTDPYAAPEIDHNWLSDPVDLEALCDGVELCSRLASTPPLSNMLVPGSGELPPWQDRHALRAWVRDNVSTTWHPSSTCRMGPADDPMAVVDNEGRVYGVSNLRVVDASIFPTGPRANLHCTVTAVAERIADLIHEPIHA
jgi:choline dehydrogenase